MQSFVYPATLTPDADDGSFVVKFVDVPEAITQGEDVEDALREAADCLEEAIANRIVTGVSIPKPSPVKKGRYAVTLAAQTAAKAALYMAIQEAKLSPGVGATKSQSIDTVKRTNENGNLDRVSEISGSITRL